MLYNARNTQVKIGDTVMDQISFGTGSKHLIMIPGVGEGFADFRGMAVPYAFLYRIFAKDYRVHVFSRRKVMHPGHSTRDMARDIRDAMEQLYIEKADIIGVSLGGMIAQHLAIDFPEKVGKLVLVVTSARPSEVLNQALSGWIEMAYQGDYRGLMVDSLDKMYTREFLQKNRWMRATAGLFGKPSSLDRFIIQAQAGLIHNCYDSLKQINVPTLVIGGEQDIAVGSDGSRELAEQIPCSRLIMYPQYGHALYEEDKNFNRTVLEFLKSE